MAGNLDGKVQNMKCFSVNQTGAFRGIAINNEPYPHIGVGEEGRGRKYTRFPLAKDFGESFLQQTPCHDRLGWPNQSGGTCPHCGEEYIKLPEDKGWQHPDAGTVLRIPSKARITQASVIKTRAKGTLLLVPEKNDEDKRILVLVNIEAGFRGSTDWTTIEKTFTPCSYRGKRTSFVLNNRCMECKALCQEVVEDGENVYSHSVYIHPDHGGTDDYAIFRQPGITVLAEGVCAQGAAGRMGGHDVRLLIMEPNTGFRVSRAGRLYGAMSEIIVFYDGEMLHVGSRDEVFPPTSDEDGELI